MSTESLSPEESKNYVKAPALVGCLQRLYNFTLNEKKCHEFPLEISCNSTVLTLSNKSIPIHNLYTCKYVSKCASVYE